MDIALETPQVEGEGFIENTEDGQGLPEPFDGLDGGFEDSVKAAGGSIVKGVPGDRAPLFTFAPPVEETGTGEDQAAAVRAVRAVRAVESPGAGSASTTG
ncbi:hypothetical protein ACIQFU_24800 [Streptomyces sp. NPDC093065]|uniref:hypothetical protein n=1 Tax=Streptomyces sp. NPDC093065 TaxID=3366021 RepID=UPI00381A350F